MLEAIVTERNQKQHFRFEKALYSNISTHMTRKLKSIFFTPRPKHLSSAFAHEVYICTERTNNETEYFIYPDVRNLWVTKSFAFSLPRLVFIKNNHFLILLCIALVPVQPAVNSIYRNAYTRYWWLYIRVMHLIMKMKVASQFRL